MKLTHTRFEALVPAARPSVAHREPAARPSVAHRERVRPESSRAGPPPDDPMSVEAAEEPGLDAGPEQLAKVEEKANEMFANNPVRVSIARDEDSGRVVVRMFDEDDQLLSQFPSEDLLRTAEHLEGMRGLLFQGKG